VNKADDQRCARAHDTREYKQGDTGEYTNASRMKPNCCNAEGAEMFQTREPDQSALVYLRGSTDWLCNSAFSATSAFHI
jgi:hypothetical protein